MKRLLLIATTSLVAACSEAGDIPRGSPYDKQSAESYSLQLGEFRVIDADKELHWFQDYVSGYQKPDPAEGPASIRPIDMATSCTLNKPSPNSRVVQVNTWGGFYRSSLYLLDKKSFDHLATRYESLLQRKAPTGPFLGKVEGELYQVDVAVTEIGEPVHLVLSSRGNILWNIVTAPRARITGMTIITGNAAAALANAPVGVPIQAIAGEMAEKCGVDPALMPVDEYPGIKMQIFQANDNKGKHRKMLEAYNRYNSFFRKQFGVDSDAVSVGVSKMNHAVVGPLPANPNERIPFIAIKDSDVLVTPATFTFFGSYSNYVAAKKTILEKREGKTAPSG